MSHVSFQKQNLAERLADQLSEAIGRDTWSAGQKLPTIRDLARQFDVSPNTAHSAVQLLARRGMVDLQPRQGAFVQRASEAVEEKSTACNQIGIVWPGVSSDTYGAVHDDWTGRIMRCAEVGFHDAGYYTTILGYFDTAELHGRVEAMRQHLAGVLTFARSDMAPLLELLDQWDIPWLTINPMSRQSEYNFVTAANQSDSAEFGSAVAQAGLRHVWILSSSRIPGLSNMDKTLGFYEGFIQVGASTSGIEVIDCGDYVEPAGYKAVADRLDESDPPQLIFATGDLMALGAMRACRDRSIRVPRDVGVVGATGLKVAELSHPSLSVIAQPMEEMGRQVARMLVRMTREKTRRVSGRRIAGQYVERESFNLHEIALSLSDSLSFQGVCHEEASL